MLGCALQAPRHQRRRGETPVQNWLTWQLKNTPMSVCKGTTKTGNPCKNRSKSTEYCHLHAEIAQKKPTKICAECGREKALFHYDVCLKNQTSDILRQIDNIASDGEISAQLKIACADITRRRRLWRMDVTWEEFCSHEHLGRWAVIQ